MQRMKNITHIRRYTLTYARGTLGIGFYIRFKHGRIRWHTARQKIFLSMLRGPRNAPDVWYAYTLAFQRIFVRMKIISLILIRFSYVSLIRNSVTGPLVGVR
jgi:hypothetical protein